MKPYIYAKNPNIVILNGELQFNLADKPLKVRDELKKIADEIGGIVEMRTPNAVTPPAIIVYPPTEDTIYYVINMDNLKGKVTDVETFARIDTLAFDSDPSIRKHTIQ